MSGKMSPLSKRRPYGCRSLRCFVAALTSTLLSVHVSWGQSQDVTGPSRPITVATSVASRESDNPEPAVHLRRESLDSFDSALQTLATQGRVAIVAEGTPYALRLSEEETAALFTSLAAPEGVPVSKAVETVAAAFDYDSVHLDEDVFALRKRYSDPRDLPFVTLDEAIHSLRSIFSSTNALNPHLPTESMPDYAPRLFAKAVGAEQSEYLRNGMPVAQLRPDERQILWDFARQT
jgi:hypothetical protein